MSYPVIRTMKTLLFPKTGGSWQRNTREPLSTCVDFTIINIEQRVYIAYFVFFKFDILDHDSARVGRRGTKQILSIFPSKPYLENILAVHVKPLDFGADVPRSLPIWHHQRRGRRHHEAFLCLAFVLLEPVPAEFGSAGRRGQVF